MTTDLEKQHLQLVQDYQDTFLSESGKRVLDDIMQRFFLFSPTMSEHHADMAFKEGQRNVVLFVLSKTKIDPVEFREKIKERKNLTQLMGEDYD